MAVPGTIQALIAAFSFGILFNAASGALVIHIKGHGSAIYRDGLRLVLILFLLTASLWALVEFLATLIEPSATSTCQVAVVFSSLFDQLGRVFVEQYLAWAVPKGDTRTIFSLVPQILVFGRLFVGIAFTAVTRTQFKPTCAPISSIRAVSITTIALDAVIIGFLSVQAFASGSATKNSSSRRTTLRTGTVRLVVVGVAVWWGASVTSLLGLDSVDLFYRTALPGIGLTILVGLVTILSQTLVVPREPPQRPDSPVSREPRDLSSSDSAEYPPSRYEDLKVANAVSISAFATKTEASRSIRRNDDGTFPSISKPVAIGTGLNGNPVQEQVFLATMPSDLAPALSEVPPLPENWGIIKNAGGRIKVSSKPKAKIAKLSISNPILNDDENVQNPLNRIHTIDLAKAASNDKQRREKYMQRIPSLIAQRPAPRPPSPPTAPDTMATEPQLTGELGRSESIRTSKTSSGLSVEGNASSTATQLSPGADVIRRRSPRQPESFPSAPFKVIRPGEPIRIPIPRPAERVEDLPQTKPEPVKTPLQRRPTTGLPSNPRAQTLKSLTKEANNQKTQTVMFINDIVYNNPDAIGDIIQGAGKVPQPPDSGDSVVNRPRPIPRKGDKDRQVFPAEISPNHQHRRSKSSGSIVSRKSILQSVPGSPTGLPSLPPMPPTTRGATNGVQSMTVEEKINLLYAAPLSAPSSMGINTKRRSSVPDLPPIPAVFQEFLKTIDGVSDLESNNDIRASKGSKRTTARTSSLLGITVDSQNGSQSNDLAAPFKSHNPVDELGNSWLPGIQLNKRDENFTASEEVKRRSSPVLPTGRQLSMSTTRSEAQSGDEETITNWGSVYSPVAPVSRQNARSTYIRKGSRNVSNSEEIPIIMFDESLDGPLDPEHGKSSFSDSDLPQHLSGQFHHRLGDDCPTFSARKDNPRPRKMPPPTPLLLNRTVSKRAVAKQPAIIPSPVESPRAAYEIIQAQLRKFEQLDRDSTESPTRRLALLANLEQEMGQLESEWQSNHEHLSRDSMSSIKTSPQQSRRTSMAPLSRPSSQRSSVSSAIAERRALRRARMQSGGGQETLAPLSQTTSQSSENAQNASRQTRLVEAHVQYVENAPELLLKRDNLNLVSETNEEAYRSSSIDGKQPIAPIHELWSQRTSDRESVKSWLWEPKINVSREFNQSYELPGLSIRSATRRQFGQLEIESSHLWQNESKSTPIGSHEGLWNNYPSSRRESAKTSRRPVTMRPTRKNKRITALPDIIENPEPLPDKRGTLGIFQFPWGEKSEHATLQYYPRQAVMAMPGTMTTRRPAADPVVESHLAQLEDTEYSSSFFDEYDEGDAFSDFSGSGDDDFDETTLWEIASLLQTSQVPSKNSLMFMPSEFSSSEDVSVLTEYVTDASFDDEYSDDDAVAEIPSPSRGTAVNDEQNLSHGIARSLLWAPKPTSQDHIHGFGLPQHETLDWNENFGEVVGRIRSRPLTNDLERIWSTGLWSPMVKETEISKMALLWTALEGTSKSRQMSNSTKNETPGLWINSWTSTNPSLGLPEPEAQVWQKLISQTSVARRPNSRLDSSVLSISSSGLWSLSKATKLAMLWTQPTLFPTLEENTLFNPKAPRVAYRTTSKPPAALSLSKRVFRHNYFALEPLASTNLWNSKSLTSVESATTGLWKPNTDIPQMGILKPVENFATAERSSASLWKRPTEVRTREHLGLFDPKETRIDFRRTSKAPAALFAFTTPRSIRENASVLTSQNLWAPQLVQATVLKGDKTRFLWQPKLPMSTRTPTLFRFDVRRIDYRTTSADLAALVVVRRSRTIEQPLERLQSSQLWAKGQVTRTESNWIAMRTLQSTSLSPSSPSSTNSSPLPSSINTDLMEASTSTVSATTPSKNKGSFFKGWFGKKKDKNSATADVSEVPVLSEDVVIRNLDTVPRAKPTHMALRHRHRRTIAYNADWEAALAEAIAASYPGKSAPKPPRQQATPQDWSEALNQAVLESYSKPSYSSWQIEDIPKDEDSTLLDVTKQHPAFFGSLETSAETVHPALTGYCVSASPAESSNASCLWVKPMEPQATLKNGLWAISSERNLARHKTQSNDYTSRYPTRRNNTAGQSAYELAIDFESQGLWKRSNESSRPRHPSLLQKNWLEDTVNKRFTRIELRY